MDVQREFFAHAERPVLGLGKQLARLSARRNESHGLNHLFSRHSRSANRARCSITQQFVVEIPSSLQISSVESSSTSRMTKTRAVRAGITWTDISKTVQNCL